MDQQRYERGWETLKQVDEEQAWCEFTEFACISKGS